MNKLKLPRLALVACLVTALAAGAIAYAATGPAIQTFTPRSEKQITNIDVLRQQIRNYYGDPLGTGIFAADSYYAKEAESVVAAGASKRLTQKVTWKGGRPGDRARCRRHVAGDLELRDLQQLGVQPRHERPLRHRPAVPGRAGHGRDGDEGRRARAMRSSS